jgi:phosphate/sulfate permease
MDRYRKMFFKITDASTTKQIIASAFISPLGEFIISYNSALNLLIGFILAKKELGLDATLSVSSFLKRSSKKGLTKASEITENSDDKILKLK